MRLAKEKHYYKIHYRVAAGNERITGRWGLNRIEVEIKFRKDNPRNHVMFVTHDVKTCCKGD